MSPSKALRRIRNFFLLDKTKMMRKIQSLNIELTAIKGKENETFRIIQHLANTYSALYYIDLSTGVFVELGKTNLKYIEDLIGGTGDAQNRLNAFVDNIVSPEHREEYSRFVQLKDVREQLRERRFISKSYRGIQTGWSEGSFIAGERNEDGYCNWVFWAVRNINEQKEVELKQQAELERHYAVIRATSRRYFCAYSINLEKDKIVEIFSKSHVRAIFGAEGVASESMKEAWDRLVTKEDQPGSKDFHDITKWNDYFLYSDIYTTEFRGVQSGWIRGILFAAKRNEYGQVTNVIYTMEMIHEQKAAEEALAKAKSDADAANQAKTSFLFNMSHDIRTPMNAIIGFTNLLRKYQDNPERRADYLDKIETSSNVLLSIINNVLEMARIEKGAILLQDIATSAQEFNDTLINLFSEMMKSKGLTFSCTMDVQHDMVFVDPTKLREIYYNILSNAFKYTEKGSVSMNLKEIPCKREGYALYQTTITDTGMGMSDDFLPHLFEEFSRENNTTDNKIEGTGLGMPIVKRLVELMEGTIEVTSQKGVGTTFVVTIPHKIATDYEPVQEDVSSIDPAGFKGKRILLTEDNDLNAEIATEVLKEVGFIIERAEDGKRAVEMMGQAQAGYYDIILMDIQMPNLNGYQATQIIRQMSDKKKAGIPILAMTANAFEEDKRNAIEAGMNGHLVKPIDTTELFKTLAKHLR